MNQNNIKKIYVFFLLLHIILLVSLLGACSKNTSSDIQNSDLTPILVETINVHDTECACNIFRDVVPSFKTVCLFENPSALNADDFDWDATNIIVIGPKSSKEDIEDWAYKFYTSDKKTNMYLESFRDFSYAIFSEDDDTSTYLLNYFKEVLINGTQKED